MCVIWFPQEGRSSANSSAWPVANPVLTCASATEAGYPSNFVADPFLYLQVRLACFGQLWMELCYCFVDVRAYCEIAGFFGQRIA